MNLRHAAALALVGWYLIVPPVRVHYGRRGPELGPVPWERATFRMVEIKNDWLARQRCQQ